MRNTSDATKFGQPKIYEALNQQQKKMFWPKCFWRDEINRNSDCLISTSHFDCFMHPTSQQRGRKNCVTV